MQLEISFPGETPVIHTDPDKGMTLIKYIYCEPFIWQGLDPKLLK